MSGGSVVLLVDDQAIVAAALRQMLEAEGDIVFHYCGDPERAVADALKLRPTVILQDLVMPGVDGFTLLERYRRTEALDAVPVIILSSQEDPQDKSRAFENGASDYLVKIPDRVELVARIRAHSLAYRVQAERDAAYRALEELKLQLEQKNAILLELSELDGLTGIANRRRFDRELDGEWRRCNREKSELALILIDVDYFKRYNDSYGHLMGDEVLRRVAAALGQALRRSSDLVARFGGEEFGVVLPTTGPAEAAMVAEILRTAVFDLAIPHGRSELDGRVTISLGVASMPASDEVRTSELVAIADEALYEAKRDGRNRVALAPSPTRS
jgi:two-component system chemotaxis family response regulator WspR